MAKTYSCRDVVPSVLGLPRRVKAFKQVIVPGGGEGDILYNGLYGEAPPERSTFIRLQVEIYKREGKSVILLCERAQKDYQMNFLAL